MHLGRLCGRAYDGKNENYISSVISKQTAFSDFINIVSREYSDHPHDKIKTAETKITKLGTVIVHQGTSPTNEY